MFRVQVPHLYSIFSPYYNSGTNSNKTLLNVKFLETYKIINSLLDIYSKSYRNSNIFHRILEYLRANLCIAYKFCPKFPI